MGSQFVKKGSEGLGAGQVIGLSAADGVLALIAWAIIGELVGWRTGIMIGAGLAALAGIVIHSGPSKLRRAESFRIRKSDIIGLSGYAFIIIGMMPQSTSAWHYTWRGHVVRVSINYFGLFALAIV